MKSVPNKPQWPILAALFLITACGGQTRWFKAGHTQQDFHVDTQQCERIATDLARAATITRQNPNIEIFADQYARCLMARGWSPGVAPAPAVVPSASIAETTPAHVWPDVAIDPDKGTLNAYGVRFRLPKAFRLLGTAKVPSSLTLKQNFLWGGEKKEYLFFSVQLSRGRVEFQDTPYPFSGDDDFLYDQSRPGDPGPQWRAFCSPRDGRQIAVVGMILQIDKTRRIMVTASTTLPEGLPETGNYVKLTPDQHTAMAAFTDGWTAWFEQMAPSSEISWKIPFSLLDLIGQKER